MEQHCPRAAPNDPKRQQPRTRRALGGLRPPKGKSASQRGRVEVSWRHASHGTFTASAELLRHRFLRWMVTAWLWGGLRDDSPSLEQIVE